MDIGNALKLGSEAFFTKDHSHINILATGTTLEPTKANIRLVVYLAGHGAASANERDQYYYFTKDARSIDIDRDATLRAASTISSSELKYWLSRTNMPLKQVVILDTCAVGAAFSDSGKAAKSRTLSGDQIRAIELLKDSTGSWILMGSAADAVSYEANRYAQGLLTYSLLQGMQGAALDNGRVEVSKLFTFAQQRVQDLAQGIGRIQRPIISAPKGQPFPIGLLSEHDRGQIHLATLKPELLRAQVVDGNFLDPLKLGPALRAELREASIPVARGGERTEASIVYLDSVVDEVPQALIPQVIYSVNGEKIQMSIRLLRDGTILVEHSLVLATHDPSRLAKALLVEIVKESGKVK